MPRPDLSIVMVNMNEEGWLRSSLGSIKKTQGELGLEFILVDNGSRDASIATAREAWPDIIVLAQGHNIGYVRANNIGMKAATGRYLMFLNNDTEILPGFLGHLIAFLDAHPEAGAVSGQILNPDGSDQGTARRLPTVTNGLFGRRSVLTRWFPNNPWSRRFMLGRHHRGQAPFEAEILSSACIAMPTALALELGGMDEDFQLYWVDAELCSRVRKRGYKIYCVPEAQMIHFEGQGGSTKTFRQRFRFTRVFHRDAYLAYVKINRLAAYDLRRWFAGLALSVRALCLMLVQILRPGRATSSGGKN